MMDEIASTKLGQDLVVDPTSQGSNTSSLPSALFSEETEKFLFKEINESQLKIVFSESKETTAMNYTAIIPKEEQEVTGYTTNRNVAVCDLPSSTIYPGPCSFDVCFSEAVEKNVNKKATPYIYSSELNKLFIRVNETCPVHFKLAKLPPRPAFVRAAVVFKRPHDLAEPVKRCLTHVDKDKESSTDSLAHFVHCTDAETTYVVHPESGRQSVLVPYRPPDCGEQFQTIFYKFTCFSSCPGSINRRQLQLIFTLEHGNEVLGRRVLELRVCSCPGRDKVAEESGDVIKRKRKTGEPALERSHESVFVSSSTDVKRRPADAAFDDDDDGELFTIQVRGRRLYNLLQTIVRNFEVSRRVTELVALRLSKSVKLGEKKEENVSTVDTEGFVLGTQNLEQLIGRLSQESKLAATTPVSSWLKELNLQKYLHNFDENGFYIMEQLRNATAEKIRQMGIDDNDDFDRIYESLTRWRIATAVAAAAASQLSLRLSPN